MDTNKTPSSGRDIFLFSKSHVPLVADLISLHRIYEYTWFKRISKLCFVPSENDFLYKVNAFMFSDVETANKRFMYSTQPDDMLLIEGKNGAEKIGSVESLFYQVR